MERRERRKIGKTQRGESEKSMKVKILAREV